VVPPLGIFYTLQVPSSRTYLRSGPGSVFIPPKTPFMHPIKCVTVYRFTMGSESI
jgi:hypothetical protein